MVKVMATRRQEKVSRVIKESVSDAIANHLGDPRIEGFVSVTRVEMSPDLRSADVYLSLFGSSESSQNKTFAAITHARTRIQSLLTNRIKSKFCPVLHFHKDDKYKKIMETINIINKAVDEIEQKNDEQ